MNSLFNFWTHYKKLVLSIIFSTWFIYKCTAIILWNPVWFEKLSEWTPQDRGFLLYCYLMTFTFIYYIVFKKK